MNNIIKFCMKLALVLLLAGCASPNSDKIRTMTDDSAAHAITIGKTTKAEVDAAFGTAIITPYDNGNEVWLYQYTQGLPRFVDYAPLIGVVTANTRTIKELTILFDKNGIAKKYRLR